MQRPPFDPSAGSGSNRGLSGLCTIDDDMVLKTAINGQAEMLVTVNRRDFEPARGMFKVKIVSPAEALTRLRRKP